jgi:hypothetical protein
VRFRSTSSPRTHGSAGSETKRPRDMLLELDDPTVIRAGGMPGKPGPDSPETDAPDDEEDEEDEEGSPT